MLLGEPGQVAGNLALLAAALFALAWAVARAHVQAITGDEGHTFRFFVNPREPSFQWYPANNNHLLNTLLMRLVTSVFGVSHLTVRAPALIGAAVYTAVSLWLSKLAGSKSYVRLPLFLCLVYNPFILDFMVAARGYGMGSAFLLCAIAGPAWCYLNPADADAQRILRVCALSSGLLALSFTAVFAFGFVVAASGLVLAAWALRSAAEQRLRVLAACTLPGLIVILSLPAYTLLHWSDKFPLGGTSILETIVTVAEASLYQLNPHILNPLLFPVLSNLKGLLLPGLVGLALLHSLLAFHGRAKLSQRNGRLFALGVAMAGIATLALLMHWVSFLLFGFPLLPQHRTAIYLIPLCTLAVGMIAAVPLPSWTGRACRGAMLGLLSLLAFYYVMCLRLTYFNEWDYQADVKKVYDVVAWYNHNRGVRDAEVGWQYDGALNFYRDMSGRETLLPFTSHDAPAKDKQLYVLSSTNEREFIAANGLKVVYRGEATDVVVAVRPELAGDENAPSSLAILP
jgi:hypothetical protein